MKTEAKSKAPSAGASTQLSRTDVSPSASIYLKEFFLECSRKNPQFSLRAFAKRLAISPSGLSQILANKKKLSLERAHDFAARLGLAESEIDYFLLLVQADATKKKELKAELFAKINTQFPQKTVSFNLTVDQFKMISEWYGIVILEIIGGLGSQWSAEKIAHYLALRKTEVELMIDRLARLELIERTATGYRRIAGHVAVESPVANDAIRKFYRNCIPKIEESISQQSPQEKVIGAEHFAFDPSQIDEVRAATHEYFDRLLKISKKGKNKTEVYQAFVNVYRTNQMTKKQDK
jgi:uncharacterized protein (TIGR02147 family)